MQVISQDGNRLRGWSCLIEDTHPIIDRDHRRHGIFRVSEQGVMVLEKLLVAVAVS